MNLSNIFLIAGKFDTKFRFCHLPKTGRERKFNRKFNQRIRLEADRVSLKEFQRTRI